MFPKGSRDHTRVLPKGSRNHTRVISKVSEPCPESLQRFILKGFGGLLPQGGSMGLPVLKFEVSEPCPERVPEVHILKGLEAFCLKEIPWGFQA